MSAYSHVPMWNAVSNPDFEDNGGSHDGWSARNENPLNWGASFDRSIFTDTATDFSLSQRPQIYLGHIVELHARQEGGFPSPGIKTVLYQTVWKPVTDLTVIYGLMTSFGERTSPCSKGIGIGVHLKAYNPETRGFDDLGNLEYYVSNGVVIADSSTNKFIKLVADSMTQAGSGNYYTYYGVSDGTTAGRRLKADIVSKYGGSGNNLFVDEIHIWSCIQAGLLGEDIWGRFKGMCLGEYPSLSLTVSDTAITDAGWGSLPSSTRLQLSDGGAPQFMFPQDGLFQNHQAAFRGGVSYCIKLTGTNQFTYQHDDWIVSSSAIVKDRYSTIGTVTCGDGVSASTTGSNVVNGYALHTITTWAPNAQGVATLTYQQNGQTSYTYLDPTACREAYIIVDPNSNARLSEQPYLRSTQRTITYDATSWSSIGLSQSVTVKYIRQFKVTLNPLDHLGNPLSRDLSIQYTGDNAGSHASDFKVTFSCQTSWWMDDQTVVSVSKETGGDTLTDQWYCYNWTLSGNWRQRTVFEGATYKLCYYHQFREELELMSSQYAGSKVYDNYFYLSVGDHVRGCAWLWDSDLDARPACVGTFTFKWITLGGQIIHTDILQSSNCYTDAFQVPQTYGEWKLQAVWSDGVEVVYNRTVSFHVCRYSLQAQAQEDGACSNINLVVNLSSIGASDIPSYGMLAAVTTGTTATSYMRNLDLIYGRELAKVTSLSTSFFTVGSSGTTWIAHIANLDSYSAHQVAFRVRVYDPLTGYTYMNGSSSALLGIGGDGDLTLAFTPLSSWWRYGLLRATYTFYVYDALGVNLLGSLLQDFGNTDPLSWIMRGTGTGELRAVYYVSEDNASTVLTQIPLQFLSSSVTVRFYIAWEDCHALSTQNQVNPVVMHFVDVTFEGGNVFATGCVPQSAWVEEGTNITLSADSPFYPKTPYYSTTTRFMFLEWKWTYTSHPQWVSDNETTIILQVMQPLQVIAFWRTQFLIEFTPYVPNTAPTDTVQVSYTVNDTLTSMSVKRASTVRVWVDAYTMFIMHDLRVNDYAWYEVNYNTPSKNVTGGASLTLPYIEKTNKVSNATVESNSFEAGGTLNLNLTLTTTYFNAQWINATIRIASENTILVDRSGLTWSDIRIRLQNNTAVITVPLPQDIGNGTLILQLTAYGKVEPTRIQLALSSTMTPPQQGGGGGGSLGGVGANFAPTITLMGIALGVVFGASASIRAVRKRRRRERKAEAIVASSLQHDFPNY